MPNPLFLIDTLFLACALQNRPQRVSSNIGLNRAKPPGFIDITGEWDTSRGKATFETHGDGLGYGKFGLNNAKIFANYTGDGLLKGSWSQAPTYACPNDKGPVELIFNKEGTSFTGKWGLCDGPLNQIWTGTKMGAAIPKPVPSGGIVPTAFDPTGSWKIGEGILLLEGTSSVEGSYKGTTIIGHDDNGKIQGGLGQHIDTNAPMLIGTWSAPPTYSCPGDKGRIELIFDPSMTKFNGNWSYCDGPMFPINQFEGTLIVGPNPLNVSGTWNTNMGSLSFAQAGNRIKGDLDNGKMLLDGKIVGNVYIGTWTKPKSYSCPYEKGNFRIVFNPNNKYFKGNWDYCEAPPSAAKIWEGTRP